MPDLKPARYRALILILAVGTAACGERAVEPIGEPAALVPTPLMQTHYAHRLGCSGVSGATVQGWDAALSTADLGGSERLLVVTPGRLRCSIPAYNASAGAEEIEFWRASDVAATENADSAPLASWSVADGVLGGVTQSSFLCEDAPDPLPASGACRVAVRWDEAAGRTAQVYSWDPAAARPSWRRAALPPELAADMPIDCADFSGSEAVIPPEAINRVDLDQDGREDILMDYTNARCTAGFGPAPCGTGGCPLQVWMTLPDGARLKAYDDQVLGWRVPGRPGVIEAAVHGGRCGGTGVDPCVTTFTWNAATRRLDERNEAKSY